MQQWIVPDCFLNILMFVCSRRRPQWTGWATGGSSSPGQGARVTEAKGKGERSGHGLQSQTQQVHGSGWAPEPRWGVSMPCKDEGSSSVSGSISLVSAVAYPLELWTACVRVCEMQVCWFPCWIALCYDVCYLQGKGKALRGVCWRQSLC